jgi:outer membrane lipoprotein-sorting protein
MHANLVKARGLDFLTRFQGSNVTLGTSYRGTARFIVRPPNLLRLTATTSKGSFVIVSDGKVLTIHEPARRCYSQMPTRDSIVGNLYLVAALVGVALPSAWDCLDNLT